MEIIGTCINCVATANLTLTICLAFGTLAIAIYRSHRATA